MPAQSTLAPDGFRLGILGSAANLAVAAPLSNNNYDVAAHTDASRIGTYYDRTGGLERIGAVVMGTESFRITATGIQVLGTLTLPAQAQGSVFAAPSGGAGVPSFRVLVSTDLPDTAVTAGAYGAADSVATFAVDAQGRLTAAATTLIDIVASQVSDFDTQVRTSRLDQMATPTATVGFGNQLVSNVLDPVSPQDAATKNYVDTIAQGLQPRTPVRLTTAAPLPNAPVYNNGVSGVGATLTAGANGALTVDSVLVAVSDRILVKDQVTQANNGVYEVTDVGDGSNPYVLTRTADFDQPAEVAGSFYFTLEGTVNQDTGWVCTTDDPVVIGTTAMTFVQFSAAGSYQAGDGLVLTGNVFDVQYDGATISLTGNSLYVPNSGIGSAQIANGSVGLTTKVSGILPVANGGSGLDGSSAANGSLLVGNGTGFTLATITAGSNIGVVNGAGTITLNVTGAALGTGAAGQVTYWTSATGVAGDAGFTYNAGTDTLTVGAAIALGNGAVGTPSFTFTSDSDTGVYRFGANELGFAAGGVAIMQASATTVTIAGKLTVTGLIDPTGMEFSPVAANPGGVTAVTLWVNSGDGNKLYFGASPVAGAGGTPGGADTEVQFNDSGSFGGSSDFTWDGSSVQVGPGPNYVQISTLGTIFASDGITCDQSITAQGDLYAYGYGTIEQDLTVMGSAEVQQSLVVSNSTTTDFLYVVNDGGGGAPSIAWGGGQGFYYDSSYDAIMVDFGGGGVIGFYNSGYLNMNPNLGTPSSQQDGDLWFDGAELYCRIGGVDLQLTNQGGGGTPGGADTEVQFNDSGSFGGSSAFTWDGDAVRVDDGIGHYVTLIASSGAVFATDNIDTDGSISAGADITAANGIVTAMDDFTSGPGFRFASGHGFYYDPGTNAIVVYFDSAGSVHFFSEGYIQLNNNIGSPASVDNGALWIDGDELFCHLNGVDVQISNQGGSTSPGGSSGDIQYNSGGSFGGVTGVTWNGSDTLTVTNGSATLTIGTNGNLTTTGIISGRVGFTDYTTTQTLPAASGSFATASVAAIVLSLWASPTNGDVMNIRNRSGGDITVGRNAQNIEGVAANFTLAAGESAQFVYHAPTTSWWIF